MGFWSIAWHLKVSKIRADNPEHRLEKTQSLTDYSNEKAVQVNCKPCQSSQSSPTNIPRPTNLV